MCKPPPGLSHYFGTPLDRLEEYNECVCACACSHVVQVLQFLQDRDGEVVSFVTAVNEHNGKLLLGTLHHKSAFVHTL